jgi:uncharacterized protein (TIGR03435 family)
MMNTLAEAALPLSAFPLSIVAKATVVLCVALLLLRCARPATASARHLVLAAAFAVLAALPLAERLVPPVGITVDAAGTAPLLPITRADTTADLATPVNAPAASSLRSSAGGDARWSWEQLLFAAWAMGAFVCLAPVLLTPWRLHRLRRKAHRWSRGDSLIRATERGRARIAVFVHDEDTPPLTYGLVRPAILLPAAAARWSDDDIVRALVHELEHVRRADWPVFIAARIVSAVYWFHPLVWIAWRRLGLEAERACDDAVLRGSERTAYAQQLVTLARERWRASAVPVLSMTGRSDLSVRIASVLDETQIRGRLGRARAAVILALATVLLAALGSLRAQGPSVVIAPADAPAFEVVSIRENTSPVLDPEDSSFGFMPGGRFVTTNWPLFRLILSAFALQPQQLVGVPDWVATARYDIAAQATEALSMTAAGAPGPGQLAIQRMLADRFQLAVHTEARELPIFALTVARSDGRLGPKISKSATDCDAITKANMQARSDAERIEVPRLPDGRSACVFSHRFGRMLGGGTTMANLAQQLSRISSRIVHNRTGLQGGFDLELEFTPDQAVYRDGAPPPGTPLDPSAPSFFTALVEQLGLKLEAIRAPVEVLVIDRIERPSEN